MSPCKSSKHKPYYTVILVYSTKYEEILYNARTEKEAEQYVINMDEKKRVDYVKIEKRWKVLEHEYL